MRYFALAGLLTACGSSNKQPPPAAPPAPPKAIDAADASAARTPTLEQQKEKYMSACRKSEELDAFCSCGWDVFSRGVTVDQMESGIARERLVEITTDTRNACSDKLPESAVKESFLDSCVAENTSTKPYCECFYGELRKKFSHSDLAKPDVAKKPEFNTATLGIAKQSQCTSKLPEAVRKPFLLGCTKSDPALQRFCDCGWKELRSVMTPAEIRMEAA